METRDQAAPLPRTLLVHNHIGGQERRAAQTFARKNPSNRADVVTIAPLSSREDVRDACEKARSAQKQWAGVPAPQRAQVLARLAELLRREKEPLARFVAREVGKPLREARGSVQEAIDTAEFF